MAFQRRVPKAAAGIGRITVHFAASDAVQPVEGTVDFDYLDGGGAIIDQGGPYPLDQNMTAAQRTAIKNFMDAIRNKIVTEAL